MAHKRERRGVALHLGLARSDPSRGSCSPSRHLYHGAEPSDVNHALVASRATGRHRNDGIASLSVWPSGNYELGTPAISFFAATDAEGDNLVERGGGGLVL